MEKKYIYKNRIVTADLPDGYAVSNKLEDNTSIHVELSDEQIAFLESNPTASMMEVWNMEIRVPIVPEPINEQALKEMMFNPTQFKDDVKRVFGDRRIVLLPYWGGIADNLKSPMQPKHFAELKNIMNGLLALNKVTQDDVDKFTSCFALQNIDINTY